MAGKPRSEGLFARGKEALTRRKTVLTTNQYPESYHASAGRSGHRLKFTDTVIPFSGFSLSPEPHIHTTVTFGLERLFEWDLADIIGGKPSKVNLLGEAGQFRYKDTETPGVPQFVSAETVKLPQIRSAVLSYDKETRTWNLEITEPSAADKLKQQLAEGAKRLIPRRNGRWNYISDDAGMLEDFGDDF